MAEITLHVLPPSHPCAAVEAALDLKGLRYERFALPMDGSHIAKMEEIYGEGNTRVPAAVIDGANVIGSNAIMERLDTLASDAHALYPQEMAELVRETAEWGDQIFQPLGRSLPWGALAFRPDALGLIGGAGHLLNPTGTDFALKMVRALWRRHDISCERIAGELASLPGHLNHIRALAADGVIGTGHVNAADLQIGATIAVLRIVGDVADQLEEPLFDRLAGLVAPREGQIPAGAFPASLVP